MPSDLHLPHAFPLGETEFAAGSLYRLLKTALADPDLASEITAAIERVVDAKIAASRERDRLQRPVLDEA
ncbi:hypothetical protein [Microvirga thermotolerans]|uniref:Uncharacterized protein n=1 Tax=Microvirga thermotolerans TaxID=2651334 RepID=A0A5P9JVK7_9HYPH|nr:hypothetical protein [Microvirga thermotolerans]QFU16229.1 hypothetical protein GDR74_08330 [Microvirga thermotolerans]